MFIYPCLSVSTGSCHGYLEFIVYHLFLAALGLGSLWAFCSYPCREVSRVASLLQSWLLAEASLVVAEVG